MKTTAWGVTEVMMDGVRRYFATEFTLEDGLVKEAKNLEDPHPYRALAYARLPDTISQYYRALLSTEAAPPPRAPTPITKGKKKP